MSRLLALAVSLACPAGYANAQEGGMWRGNFAIGRHGVQMSPCRSGERVRVEDRTPGRALEQAYRELTQRPGRPIFVEFSGVERDGVVLAEVLHRAHGEGPGCREDIAAFRWRAFGMEPFWQLEARDTEVRLLPRMGAPEIAFSGAGFRSTGNERRYEGSRPGSVLRVRLIAEACRDRLASAIFSYRAVVELDGKVFGGCAYAGTMNQRR